jgi:hypothetical protein
MQIVELARGDFRDVREGRPDEVRDGGGEAGVCEVFALGDFVLEGGLWAG